MASKAPSPVASATPRAASAKPRRARKAATREYDADASRADILAMATREFSEKGLSGARVDSIAARTKINKRMIYYYFGSKEGLYRAVLERSYGHIRMSESAVELDALAPEEALRQLVRHTFDYHNMHPDFVRLVMNENMHFGAHIGAVPGIKERNHSVIDTLQTIIDALAYGNTSNNPGAATRVVTLTSVSDTGGTANLGIGQFLCRGTWIIPLIGRSR